jgi:hypothetical protein
MNFGQFFLGLLTGTIIFWFGWIFGYRKGLNHR